MRRAEAAVVAMDANNFLATLPSGPRPDDAKSRHLLAVSLALLEAAGYWAGGFIRVNCLSNDR